jgi:protein-tyrosine-phosphatase
MILKLSTRIKERWQGSGRCGMLDCMAMKRILFLCTGNYYRSRYAEELFNHLASRDALNWRATSRALAIERGAENVGPIAQSTLQALAVDNISPADAARFPIPCTAMDLIGSDLVVAVKEAEHRDLLTDRFSGWQDRVIYWHVHDIDAAPPDEALSMLRVAVVGLVRELEAAN